MDQDVEARRDAFAARLGDDLVAAMDLQVLYLGDRLGLYRALRDGGPATAGELAGRAAIDARYAREWLEHQATAGVIDVDDVSADPDARRYALPAAHAEVLLDPESPTLLGPIARFVVGMSHQLPAVIDAYRTGAGVDWAEYGPDVIEAQEAINRPQFQHYVGEWINDLPDIAARLHAGGRIADLGCGTGWSSIWMARHFPEATVDGIDIDADSIERAQDTAEREGMSDRVAFRLADGAAADGGGPYDLVTIFEALHDMANPVEVLDAARALLAPGGAVLIGDERADEAFSAPVDSLDRMFYGFSVLACLPNGRVGETSVATGTVMRPSTVAAYAGDAGFTGFSILPTEHGQFRFYRLDP
jgi:ubiquinone/menaquinone biosynthesis C-methylase UbiE